MPTSSSEHKDWMLDIYTKLKPEVTVDVGPGKGTYSDLMRPSHRGTWKCIEAWGPYVTQFNLWKKYDHVIVSDVRHCDLFTVHYAPDVVILGDIVEHIPKEEATYLIDRMKGWSKNILISIPVGTYEQADDVNWFETHRATWEFDEMKEMLSDGLQDSICGNVLGNYWWQR